MAKVAVVDNGILETEIPGLVIRNRNRYGQASSNLKKFWYSMHGTICANIIMDISPGVEFLDVKVTDIDIPFSIWRLIEELEWCEKEAVDIINLSLGTVYTEGFNELQACVKRLKKRGIIFVAACHPEGMRSYPAALDGVIKVSGKSNGEYQVKIPSCTVGNKWKVNVARYNSFAAPVITGHIANYLDKWGRGADSDISDYLCCQKGISFNKNRNQEIDVPIIQLEMEKSVALYIVIEFQNEGYMTAVVEKNENIYDKWSNGRYDIIFVMPGNRWIAQYPSDVIIKKDEDGFRLEYVGKSEICETIEQIRRHLKKEFDYSEI